MDKVLIIANSYPYNGSNHFIFLKNLIDIFVDNDVKCTVIETQSYLEIIRRKTQKRPYFRDVELSSQNKYRVYAPKTLLFPNILFLKKINQHLLSKKVNKTIKKLALNYDFIYAHHLVYAGFLAYKVHKEFNKPYFLSFGESNLKRLYNHFTLNEISQFLEKSSGIIVPSISMLKELEEDQVIAQSTKSILVPNGVNQDVFYFYNKKKHIRQRYNVGDNDFVVIFVGSFTDRKGVMRLNQALKEINNSKIKAVFIGKGKLEPDYKNIIFKGPHTQDVIADYLNLSDVFVLPTLNEGSCNAIIEAISCGLPVISSNKPFNDDILNNLYSIRVDSLSIEDIKKAILIVLNNEKLRKEMAYEALKASKQFNVNVRANKVISFAQINI